MEKLVILISSCSNRLFGDKNFCQLFIVTHFVHKYADCNRKPNSSSFIIIQSRRKSVVSHAISHEIILSAPQWNSNKLLKTKFSGEKRSESHSYLHICKDPLGSARKILRHRIVECAGKKMT